MLLHAVTASPRCTHRLKRRDREAREDRGDGTGEQHKGHARAQYQLGAPVHNSVGGCT